jgi:hypothetical protein
MSIETIAGTRMIHPKREAVRIAQEEARDGEPRALWRINWMPGEIGHTLYSYAVETMMFSPPEIPQSDWRFVTIKPRWEYVTLFMPVGDQGNLGLEEA